MENIRYSIYLLQLNRFSKREVLYKPIWKVCIKEFLKFDRLFSLCSQAKNPGLLWNSAMQNSEVEKRFFPLKEQLDKFIETKKAYLEGSSFIWGLSLSRKRATTSWCPASSAKSIASLPCVSQTPTQAAPQLRRYLTVST